MISSQDSSEVKDQPPKGSSALTNIARSAVLGAAVFFCTTVVSTYFMVKQPDLGGAAQGIGFLIYCASPLAALFGIVGGVLAYIIRRAFSIKGKDELFWTVGGILGGVVSAAALLYLLILH
jgi:hypothetical protein